MKHEEAMRMCGISGRAEGEDKWGENGRDGDPQATAEGTGDWDTQPCASYAVRSVVYGYRSFG